MNQQEIIEAIFDEMKADCIELARIKFKWAKDKNMNNGEVMEYVTESLENAAIDLIKGKRKDNIGYLGKSAIQECFASHCLARAIWGELPDMDASPSSPKSKGSQGSEGERDE